METDSPSHSTPQDLRRPRRLHPLAILMPFGSYSKPKGLGGLATPIWIGVAVIVTMLFITNIFAGDIRSAFEDPEGDPTINLTIGEPDAPESSTSKPDKKPSLIPSFEYQIGVTQLLIVALLLYKWLFFKWWVEDGAIWTRGGAINRWTRRVSIDHIVAVDRSTNLLQKALRVSRISAETTANAAPSSDVTLGCLARKQAESLHLFLNQDLHELDDDPDRSELQRLVVSRPGWWELIAAGAFSLQVTRTAIILFVLYKLVNSRTSGWLSSSATRLADDVYTKDHMVLNVIGTIVALIFIFWLTSILDFLASFTRFDLSRRGSWILLRSGFFRKSVRLIRIDAIYGFEVVSSPLQRRIGKSTLRMRMPAYGSPPNYKLVLHPSISPDVLAYVMEELVGMDGSASAALNGAGVHPLVEASRSAFMTLWPIRIAIVSLVALVAVLVVAPAYWWGALALLLLAFPAAVWGYYKWKQAAWYASGGEWLIVRRGVINRCAVVAAVDRIQYLRWAQSIFSRSPTASFALVLCVATSGEAGTINRLLALLSRALAPSMVTLKNVTAGEAAAIATAIGEIQALPPELAAKQAA